MILAGRVRLKDQIFDKPGRMVAEDIEPDVAADLHPFSSRGGLKLEHALNAFLLSVENITAIDIGASTGGFTDCLLQRGVTHVIAVDVGYGQLDWKLRSDPRVQSLDRTNARYLKLEDIGGQAVDLAVIDVAFISLRLILPAVVELLKAEGDIVALVKPQFEVGKEDMENKGIIKDPRKHRQVLIDVRDCAKGLGWKLQGLVTSPVTGQKGNREFLIHLSRDSQVLGIDDEQIEAIVNEGKQDEGN
jgi:23S rRNA (cytidine1920-2'-O)/16S rRNA (cytidine1409-2'-O)-methyltransferase